MESVHKWASKSPLTIGSGLVDEKPWSEGCGFEASTFFPYSRFDCTLQPQSAL